MVPSDGSRHAKDKRNCVHFPWLQSRKMEFLETNIETIREFVKENKTHKQISKILLEAFPEVKRGFSERNIRLFCANHGIKRLSEAQVDYIVAGCVREVSGNEKFP